MADQQVICESQTLVNSGKAMRFVRMTDGEITAHPISCIAFRFDEKVYAYRNFCPHRGTELDWQPGEVFDMSGLFLICATHGALFEPHTGKCIEGPCKGASLQPITIEEKNGIVATIPTC